MLRCVRSCRLSFRVTGLRRSAFPLAYVRVPAAVLLVRLLTYQLASLLVYCRCSATKPCPTAARQASLSITIFQSFLKLMSIESMMPSSHLILCCPLLPSPSIFPSISVFSKEMAICIRWPEHWNFSFSISPSNEYSGLISFRIDWLLIYVYMCLFYFHFSPSSKYVVII